MKSSLNPRLTRLPKLTCRQPHLVFRLCIYFAKLWKVLRALFKRDIGRKWRRKGAERGDGCIQSELSEVKVFGAHKLHDSEVHENPL